MIFILLIAFARIKCRFRFRIETVSTTVPFYGYLKKSPGELERLTEYAGECGLAGRLLQIEEGLSPDGERTTSEGVISPFPSTNVLTTEVLLLISKQTIRQYKTIEKNYVTLKSS